MPRRSDRKGFDGGDGAVPRRSKGLLVDGGDGNVSAVAARAGELFNSKPASSTLADRIAAC